MISRKLYILSLLVPEILMIAILAALPVEYKIAVLVLCLIVVLALIPIMHFSDKHKNKKK